MPVILQISTLLVSRGYLSGHKAQLYVNSAGSFERVETKTITNSDYAFTVNFEENVTGPFRIVIRDSNGKLHWRSAELQPHADGSAFRYTLARIEEARTTLSGDEMEAQVPVPMVQDLEDLDEDLIVEEVRIVVHDDHLSVKPRGKVAKGEDWTILQSTFDITYKIRLSPSTSIRDDRMVGITSVDFQMDFSNLITGIGANCVKDQIRTQVRDRLRSSINDAIHAQLRNQVAGQFGENNPLNNEVTATVVAVRMVQTGTQTVAGIGTLPVFSLQLQVDASIPSQMIEEQTSSNSGCLGMLLMLAALAAGIALL